MVMVIVFLSHQPHVFVCASPQAVSCSESEFEICNLVFRVCNMRLAGKTCCPAGQAEESQAALAQKVTKRVSVDPP